MRRSRHTSMLAILCAVGFGAGLALCIAVIVGGNESNPATLDRALSHNQMIPHDPSLARNSSLVRESRIDTAASATDSEVGKPPAVLAPDTPLAKHVDSRHDRDFEARNQRSPFILQVRTAREPGKSSKVGWYPITPGVPVGPSADDTATPIEGGVESTARSTPVRSESNVSSESAPVQDESSTIDSAESLFAGIIEQFESSADNYATDDIASNASTTPEIRIVPNQQRLFPMAGTIAVSSRRDTAPATPTVTMPVVDSGKRSSINGTILKKPSMKPSGSMYRLVADGESLEDIARDTSRSTPGASGRSVLEFKIPSIGSSPNRSTGTSIPKPRGGSFAAVSLPTASIAAAPGSPYGQRVNIDPALDADGSHNGSAADENSAAGPSSAQSDEAGSTISIRPMDEPPPQDSAAIRATQNATNGTTTGTPEIGDRNDGRLSIRFMNEDIRSVIETLGDYGGLNILAGSSVQGNVSVVLNGVTVEQALDAILKSAGFSMRREGKFIYVGSQKDFDKIEQMGDRIGIRIYRPNYVTAAEFEKLITPLLTPDLGKISVTSPPEAGIGSDDDQVGGNSYAGTDVLLVRDYEAVLAQIDQMIAQIDIRPMQVAIETMILQVKLQDEDKFGVNFQFLRNQGTIKLGLGDPVSTLANFTFEKGALKFGFLDSSLGAFIEAIETVGHTDIIATPRVIVLNKHRAEIQIGEQRGYLATQTTTDTSTVSSVQFLETGTILRLRPFISDDGIIRLEIHPELSTGDVKSVAGVPLPNKTVTQVTTNVMVRDGCTIVIGGLIREQIEQSIEQVPVLGSLPWIGSAFRSMTEKTERYEVIIILTPRIIYEPGASKEGDSEACEFLRRHAVFAEKMSPLGRRSIARRYIRLAQNAWGAGDRNNALRFAEMAVQFDPLNRVAIELRSNIWLSNPSGDHTLGAGNIDGVSPDPLTGIRSTITPETVVPLGRVMPTGGVQIGTAGSAASNRTITGSTGDPDAIQKQQIPSLTNVETEMPSWMLQRVQGGGMPVHPYDRGRTGVHTNIHIPGKLQ